MANAPNPLLGVYPGVSSRQAEVQAYYTEFLASNYSQYAAGWLTFAAAHTNLDAGTALQAYVDQLAAQGLVKAVSTSGGVVGTALNQVVTGAVKGAEKVAAAAKPLTQAWDAATAVPRFLSMLTNGALWIRVGEVVLGLILVAVGVAELTHAVPVATAIAKKVGAGAALAAV